ncbi:MAG: hypothetical protein K6U12_06160 [Armatimonadetes bacterium]|nr:hypothetical protein [Armatimonadota bacterium]CUU37999.1 hypothetical protein DCOP10_12381 [Armatimonadetes bacterium DC]
MRRSLIALSAVWLTVSAMAQCLITDFEGYTLGLNGAVLFRQPSFSGSTSGFLAFTGLCDIPNGVYNCSVISDEQAHGGTQSLKVAWQWNGNPNAWLRLTTFNAAFVPNPEINFSHKLAVWVYVPSGTPDFYLALGVRETGSTAGCAGNGGAPAVGIEWVGATNPSGPPGGKRIDQKDQWVRVVFDIPNEPLRGFAGSSANGMLDTTTGTLEHLAFTPVDPNQVGPYIVYLDDIETFVGIPGDVNGDGCVDDADLLAVLFAFGQTGSGLPEDVNGDGVVDDADLLTVLFNFGQGC